MLLLAREQLNLDLIQGYLQSRQSIFKGGAGQLVIFSTITRLGCIVQPTLFSS